MMSCEVKLRLRNIVHCPQLKALDVICPDYIHEYAQSCFVKSWTNDSRTSKLWNKNLCLLYLWMRVWRRIQKEWKSNSLISSVILIVLENVWKKLARLWSPLTQRKDFCTQILWVKNECDVLQWLYVGIVYL